MAGALLAVDGILTGLLFQILISVLSAIQREADRETEPRSIAKAKDQLRLLKEINANISYAVLVGCSVAAGLGAALLVGSKGWVRIGVPLVSLALSHFMLVQFMILKRYRAMGVESIKQAEDTLKRRGRRGAA